MTQSGEPPQGALVVRTYGELDQFVEAFAEGLLNLLLIIGRPGVQKSQAVKAAVGKRACWIEGSATAFGLYGQLYRHRNQPVVIDDVDGLFADRAAVRLLKCLCQTEPRKRLGWYSAATAGDDPGIPSSFDAGLRWPRNDPQKSGAEPLSGICIWTRWDEPMSFRRCRVPAIDEAFQHREVTGR